VKARIGWRGLTAAEYTDSGPYLIAGNHIRGSEIAWDLCDHLSVERFEESSEIILQEGDIIVSKDGTIGRCAHVDTLPGPATINGTMMLVRPAAKHFHSRFVYHYFQGHEFRRLVEEKISGGTVPHLFQRDIVQLRIPKPSISEQRKIAQILDSIEQIISRTRAVIEQTRRLKTALLQNLLTNGLPGMHRGFRKHPALGRIPHCWKCLSIDELATKDPRSIQSGPFGSSLLHSEFGSEGVLVIGIDNVLDGRFSIGAEHRIRPEKFNELKKYQARPSDVLITVMATVGRCCVVPENLEPALITKHVYRIAVDQSLCLPDFLMWNVLANPHVSRQLYGNAQGQTRDGLNGQSIRRLRIPIPPLEEQRVIVRTVDAIQGREDQESKNLNQLSIVKSGLSAALLDGRIRVRR